MSRKQYEHICEWCGVSFSTENKRQKHCSRKCFGLHNYSNGNTPPTGCLKGRRLSEDHKLKISQAHMGKPSTSPWSEDPSRHDEMIKVLEKARSCMGKITMETRRKKRLSMLGKNVTNGNSKINSLARGSLDSKIWRESVFQRDDWTCQACGVRGGRLHAHHIKSFADYPEDRFLVENGVTLCFACHAQEHANIGFFVSYARSETITEMVLNG